MEQCFHSGTPQGSVSGLQQMFNTLWICCLWNPICCFLLEQQAFFAKTGKYLSILSILIEGMHPTLVASSRVRYISETILLPRSPSLWSEWSWFLTRCHSLVPLSRSGVIMGVRERRLSGLLAVLSILSGMVDSRLVRGVEVCNAYGMCIYILLIKVQFFKMSLLCYTYPRLHTHCGDVFFVRSSAEGET